MAYQLILFDLDDTLCDYAGARAIRLRSAFALALSSRPEVSVDLDRLIAESIEIHPHGTDHFGELLLRHGIDHESAVVGAQEWYRANRFYGLTLFPDALKTLEIARTAQPGRMVGLVTNGPAEVQREKIGLLKLLPHVDFALISGEFGVAKPDPAIFAEALRLGSAAAEETIFIGDSPEFDIAGARASSIASVWMNRTGRPWSHPGEPPDHTITGLTELHALLSGPGGDAG